MLFPFEGGDAKSSVGLHRDLEGTDKMGQVLRNQHTGDQLTLDRRHTNTRTKT